MGLWICHPSVLPEAGKHQVLQAMLQQPQTGQSHLGMRQGLGRDWNAREGLKWGDERAQELHRRCLWGFCEHPLPPSYPPPSPKAAPAFLKGACIWRGRPHSQRHSARQGRRGRAGCSISGGLKGWWPSAHSDLEGKTHSEAAPRHPGSESVGRKSKNLATDCPLVVRACQGSLSSSCLTVRKACGYFGMYGNRTFNFLKHQKGTAEGQQ